MFIFIRSIVNAIVDNTLLYFYFGSNSIFYPTVIFNKLPCAVNLLQVFDIDIDSLQATPNYPIFVVFDEYWHRSVLRENGSARRGFDGRRKYSQTE